MLMIFITAWAWSGWATGDTVLPSSFRVLPREVAVLTGLILTFMGIGFAVGPMLVGVVTQFTGSIQTGLIVLSLLTGLGVLAALAYPNKPGTMLGDGAAQEADGARL